MLLDSVETKEKILTEFLTICTFDGWNDAALSQAIKNCGIDEKNLPLIFENGCLDLAEFYVESQNKKSTEILGNLSEKKIRDKIRLSIYARFEVEKNHKIALQRLANFYSNPKNFLSFEVGARPMIQGLKSCYKIADFIWKNISDQSTDFNFYTKRLTLGKIIFRTFFVFLKDESDDLQKTKNFIDAEIEKVMKFEKYKSQLKKFSAVTKKTCGEFFLDEKGMPKSPREIIKNLPFFRLLKK